MDNTWVQHFQPETKQQLKQWKHLGPPSPKEAKTAMSAGKVMTWDAGVLLVDYLDKCHNITGAYFVFLLKQLGGGGGGSSRFGVES